MPKVYIISKGGFDFSKAESYGEFVYLSDELVDRFNVQKLYLLFNDMLKDSGEDDFLLITGLPIMAAVASSILVNKHGKVNYLLFANGVYMERNIVY